MSQTNKDEPPCKELTAKQLTSKSTRLILVIGLTFVVIGLFFFGFFPRFFQTRENERQAERHLAVQVIAMVAKPQESLVDLVLPSVTQANHVTPIWARTNGYLVKLCVDIGDQVKKGQLLAQLDTPEVDQQYEQAVFDYKSTKVRRDLAKINAKRAKMAYEADPGTISKLDRDQFLANYDAEVADLLAQEANMKRYKELVDFKYIVAPFDGVIIERDIDIGSLVSAGSNGTPQQLFVIAQTDIMRLFVSVPQTYFQSIQEGVEGITTIREFGNKAFTSTVARYAKALDQTAHTMLTELHIDNKNGELLPGLYADVTLRIKPRLAYFIVPTPAVIIRAGDPTIAVLDDQDVAHLRNVKIGLDYGKTLQIVSGIEPNDRVIINPTEKVREGVACHVVETKDNAKYFL